MIFSFYIQQFNPKIKLGIGPKILIKKNFKSIRFWNKLSDLIQVVKEPMHAKGEKGSKVRVPVKTN